MDNNTIELDKVKASVDVSLAKFNYSQEITVGKEGDCSFSNDRGKTLVANKYCSFKTSGEGTTEIEDGALLVAASVKNEEKVKMPCFLKFGPLNIKPEISSIQQLQKSAGDSNENQLLTEQKAGATFSLKHFPMSTIGLKLGCETTTSTTIGSNENSDIKTGFYIGPNYQLGLGPARLSAETTVSGCFRRMTEEQRTKRYNDAQSSISDVHNFFGLYQ